MKSCFNKNKTYLIFGTGITGKSAVEFCIKHKLSYYITDDNSENLKNIHIPENNKIYSYNNKILSEKNIGESKNFWQEVFLDLKDRGIKDTLYVISDGLKGIEEVI